MGHFIIKIKLACFDGYVFLVPINTWRIVWGTMVCHNIDKFSKLTYILSCHYDPYNDKIAEWLEDSYIKNVQGNGKVMLALFLNDDDKGKYDIFLLFFDILPFLLVIFSFCFHCRIGVTPMATLEA
jgi:hypothetical protein